MIILVTQDKKWFLFYDISLKNIFKIFQRLKKLVDAYRQRQSYTEHVALYCKPDIFYGSSVNCSGYNIWFTSIPYKYTCSFSPCITLINMMIWNFNEVTYPFLAKSQVYISLLN